LGSPDTAQPRGRGRPRKDIQRDVIHDLMEAAEAVLAKKTSHEITLHEIASTAHVSEAMIHYYFGGKEGLMVAIFDEIMREAPYQRAEAITQDCLDKRSIRPLIEQLVTSYYKRAGLIKMTLFETTTPSSLVRKFYYNRYLDVTPKFIENLITSMVDQGIYSNFLNIKFITSSILSLVMGPIINTSEILDVSKRMTLPELIDQISYFTDFAMRAPTPDVAPL
jgi:AcrR family transcriptional regulator